MKYFVRCLGPLTDARQSSNNNDDDDNNNTNNDDDLEVQHPQSGSSSTGFLVELEFRNVGFEERGKPECPEKNLSEQRREPKTNSTHIWRRRCLHCNNLSS